MKFLCGNCKAKYQIADEKVSGRTLRMKCRRCGHDILIDGHGMAASVPPAAASSVPAAAPGSARKPGAASVIPAPPARSDAQPRASASIPQPPGRAVPARSRPPSALSQDFRRHVAAPPEVPQRTAPYDLWHVAIQDVPVGPMTREELARKVESGAVTGESLCWREGMDDWRPMSELAELAQLLRKARAGEGSWSGRPPPRRTSNTGRAAEADVLEDDIEPTRASVAPAAPAFGPPPKAARAEASLPMPAVSTKLPAFQPGANPFQASASQPMAAAAAPAPQPAFVQPQPIAGEPSGAVALPAAPAARGGFQLSPGLTTGLAIGLLMGILLIGGPMLYRNSWGSPTPVPVAQVTPTPTPTPAPAPSTSAPDLVIDVPEDKPVEPEKPTATATKPTTGPVRGTKTDPKADTSTLSEAERKLLERMGGSGASGSGLEGMGGKTKSEDAPSGPALTANQLMGVVQNNKTQLQRCYETALRASGGKQDGAIKITVNVTVGTSGSVKGVVTQGNGMSSMNDCLKSSVKRWRFPQSGGESEFAFPLVFQPGA